MGKEIRINDNIRLERKDQLAILRVLGEIDLDTAMILKDEVEKLRFDGIRSFIINLSDIDYCDSSSLGNLLAINSQMSKIGGRVALVSTSQAVHDTFSITGLTDFFSIFSNEEKVLEAWKIK